MSHKKLKEYWDRIRGYSPTNPIEEAILTAYYDGFNQSHYSHLHPDVCPPKECESAGLEYLESKRPIINKATSEYAQLRTKELEERVKELRNKLSPIFNYLQIQSDFDALDSKENTVFNDGVKMESLKRLIQAELPKMGKSMQDALVIIEEIESNISNHKTK